MHEWLEPGARVRLNGADDWGVGQVQSVIDGKATVNFEHRGKVVVDLRHAQLELIFDGG